MAEFIAGMILGLLVGWELRARWKAANPYTSKRPRRFEATTWLQIGGEGYGLRSIDPARMLAVLARIAGGRPLTFRNSTGRNRLMTRTEFERLRVELLNRQFAKRTRRGALSPTPTGRRFAADFLARSRAAQLHNQKQRERR